MNKTLLSTLVAVGLIGSVSAQSNTSVTWASLSAPAGGFANQDSDPWEPYYATNTVGSFNFTDSSSISFAINGEIRSGSSSSSSFSGSNPNTFTSSGFIYSSPSDAWTSTSVSNLPTNGDHISLIGSQINTQTITFSQPVTGLVMDIATLGAWNGPTSATWSFNQPFQLLSQDYTFAQTAHNNPFKIYGNNITGSESSGSILFSGSFSSLSWNINNPEGTLYTIGTLQATAVPEPSTYALLGIGTIGMLIVLHRKKIWVCGSSGLIRSS